MNTFLKERILFSKLILIITIIFFLTSCSSYANRIYKENSKAVVEIVIYDNKGNPIGQGSGFIIRKDGVIVTSYHVITKAEDIEVKAGDKVLNVEGLLHADKENDIVMLKVESKELPIVKLGDIDKAVVGENVYVISRHGGRENTLSEGILQGVRKIDPKTKLLQITELVWKNWTET
jgi:S1-C subfamily serine protease